MKKSNPLLIFSSYDQISPGLGAPCLFPLDLTPQSTFNHTQIDPSSLFLFIYIFSIHFAAPHWRIPNLPNSNPLYSRPFHVHSTIHLPNRSPTPNTFPPLTHQVTCPKYFPFAQGFILL